MLREVDIDIIPQENRHIYAEPIVKEFLESGFMAAVVDDDSKTGAAWKNLLYAYCKKYDLLNRINIIVRHGKCYLIRKGE